MIRDMDKELSKQSADLCIGNRAGVSTKPMVGVKVCKAIGHVKSDIIRDGFRQLHLATCHIADACSNNLWIEMIHRLVV